MDVQENGKRQTVFLTLVDEGEPLTPTEIGAEVDESRQTVKYHLDKLVEGGLVVREGEAYRCQSVFTDDEFEEQFVELVGEMVPEVSERIDVNEGLSAEGQAAAVFNCIRMFLALEVLGPGDERQAE